MKSAHAITLSLFLALSPVTACAQFNPDAPISSVAPDTVVSAKKALTAAHDLHRGVADFLTIAATTNLCHAQCASKAKLWLDQSETALLAADRLIALGDAAGVEAKIAIATSLIGQIQSQIGHN